MTDRRKAPMPAQGYRASVERPHAGCVVHFVAENGSEHNFDLSNVHPAPALAEAVAAAVAAASSPTGRLRTPASVSNWTVSARSFFGWLARTHAAVDTPTKITAGMWDEWLLQTPSNSSGYTLKVNARNLLRTMADLPAQTQSAVGRRIGPQPAGQGHVSYTADEFRLIEIQARRTLREANHRISSTWAALAGGEPDGNTSGHPPVVVAALEQLMREGSLPTDTAGTPWQRSVVASELRSALGLRPRAFVDTVLCSLLFPRASEIFGAAVLLVCLAGYNLDTLANMRVPSHDPAVGDDSVVHHLQIHKSRRRSPERFTTHNLSDLGTHSAGRVITNIIELTTPAREFLRQRRDPRAESLFLFFNSNMLGSDIIQVGPAPRGASEWCSHCLERDPDWPFRSVSLARLRRSQQVYRPLTATGNSQRVHDDKYRLRDPNLRQSSRAVVERGLLDAVEAARQTVRMRIVPTRDAAPVQQAVGGDSQLAEAVQKGDLDTVLGSCLTDMLNSPFEDSRESACRAHFLMCLTCVNALATPAHLPKLVAAHRALGNLRSVLPPQVWESDWAEHYLRLIDVLSHFTEGQKHEAAIAITSAMEASIEELLRGGLSA